ncbi:MAG TPA: SpoIVB peptidase S55 domain-containing protein, partial [Armatimonadota bacterium]
MRTFAWIALLFVLLFAPISSHASPLSWDAKAFMGVDEIKPGMIGYGKTVFAGTKIEKFNIKVIGVLKKLDFGFDMILIKVTSGPVVTQKLQTVEGMSGSPIYINNRLIGAYAYGWNFQQEPISGVTPIAAMLECTQPGATRPPNRGTLVPTTHVLKIGNRLIANIKVGATASEAEQLQAKADPTTMVLAPVATPLFASGLPGKGVSTLQRIFADYNLRVVTGPGRMPGKPTKLEPGSAVAVSLMEGDANLSAVGTVTYVKGDTVLAFGHPFLGIGKVNMPMSTAYVQGIVNSSLSSFKLASPVARVGTLTSDRDFAVAGVLGQTPNIIPVNLHLTDPSRRLDRRYAVDMMTDPAITPILLYEYIMLKGAMQLADFSSADGTFTAHTSLVTKTYGTITQRMVVAPEAGLNAPPLVELAQLIDTLMLNPYESVPIQKVGIDLNYTPGRNFATIEKVIPDRPVAHPGETINLKVRIRPFGKTIEMRTIPITIPPYATEPALIVLVTGGNSYPMIKPLITPLPVPEEGVRGLIRWYTNNPTAQTMLTAKVFPSPSYVYRGRTLNEVPLPLLDLLRLTDNPGGMPSANLTGGGGNSDEPQGGQPAGSVRPSIYTSIEDVPYTLRGGQMFVIAIEIREPRGSGASGAFSLPASLPILSGGQTIAMPAGDESSTPSANTPTDDEAYWFSAQQRARQAMIATGWPQPSRRSPVVDLLQLTPPPTRASTTAKDDRRDSTKTLDKTIDKDSKATPADAEDSASAEGKTDESPGEKNRDNALLTSKRPNWELNSRPTFLKGMPIGTAITSQGTVVLMPTVESRYQTTDLMPWRVVYTNNGLYLTGWGSNKLLHITGKDQSEVVFPKNAADGRAVESITALSADANGNLLFATWPDQQIRLVTPDGVVRQTWMMPFTMVWALAVTSEGRRYAAGNDSAVFELGDAHSPIHVACTVPDQGVYTLAPAQHGDLLLGTLPRGKVYRLSGSGTLTSVYDARDGVSSLASDEQGNVYVGTTPSCEVYRIDADGTRVKLMTGMGNGNRHVLALALVGDDLYAATGPAGGIYRIAPAHDPTPVVTPIYAREDMRTGEDVNAATGPESIMVNALAVTPEKTVMAVASSPGQVFAITPREHGVYLSPVFAAPVLSRWGEVDIHAQAANGGPVTAQSVRVETRSGQTAWPDATWSGWAPLDAQHVMSSPNASYAQLRARIDEEHPESSVGLDYLRLHYQPVNQAPLVKWGTPSSGAYVSGKTTLKWEGKDPDSDQLTYMVFASADGGQRWILLTTKTDGEQAAKGTT